jgi:hypothetical protein
MISFDGYAVAHIGGALSPVILLMFTMSPLPFPSGPARIILALRTAWVVYKTPLMFVRRTVSWSQIEHVHKTKLHATCQIFDALHVEGLGRTECKPRL